MYPWSNIRMVFMIESLFSSTWSFKQRFSNIIWTQSEIPKLKSLLLHYTSCRKTMRLLAHPHPHRQQKTNSLWWSVRNCLHVGESTPHRIGNGMGYDLTQVIDPSFNSLSLTQVTSFMLLLFHNSSLTFQNKLIYHQQQTHNPGISNIKQ